MKHALPIALTLVLVAGSARAADDRQSYKEFREELRSDFSAFRSRVLEHYSDFLNGQWHEFEPLRPKVRDEKPKPRTVPVAPDAEPVPVDTTLPQKAEIPVIEPERKAPAAPDMDIFSFYGMQLRVPKVNYSIRQRLLSTSDYGSQWQELASRKIAQAVTPALKKIADDAGLNDYLTYQLVCDYVDSKFPSSHETSRVSLAHYLMANLGYDVRIAVTDDGTPLMMLPVTQTLYGRSYLTYGDDKYYLFPPSGRELVVNEETRIATCQLPAEATRGKKINAILSELRIPVKPKKFDISYGRIHLTGEVNENLMPILYRYPLMNMGDYAASELQPELRKQLAEQIRTQLDGLGERESVEELLRFMQHAFAYATDDEYHGFEKPYFLEETLFYPKNDCEDRAIFYSYFLWNALGRPAQIINFPGHEAATVRLSEAVNGTAYNSEGANYVISDPTYVGAPSGLVMPAYRGVNPRIDFSYK